MKACCSSLRPTGSRLRGACLSQSPVCGGPGEQAARLVEQPLAGDHVEDDAELAGALAGLAASPAQIISAASDGPMSGVSRCVPPQPGIRPIFTSGRPISVLGWLPARR